MHYRKAPRLKETKGSPPSGSALNLRRVGQLRTTAGGMFRKTTSKPLEARFARSADIGRHSFSRNSRRAVLALKGSLRRAKEGAPLTAAGRSALLSAKKEWGSPEWRRLQRSWPWAGSRNGQVPKAGLKIINAFSHPQSSELRWKMAP